MCCAALCFAAVTAANCGDLAARPDIDGFLVSVGDGGREAWGGRSRGGADVGRLLLLPLLLLTALRSSSSRCAHSIAWDPSPLLHPSHTHKCGIMLARRWAAPRSSPSLSTSSRPLPSRADGAKAEGVLLVSSWSMVCSLLRAFPCGLTHISHPSTFAENPSVTAYARITGANLAGTAAATTRAGFPQKCCPILACCPRRRRRLTPPAAAAARRPVRPPPSGRKVIEAEAVVIRHGGEAGAIRAEAHAPHLVAVVAAGLQQQREAGGGWGRGRGDKRVSLGRWRRCAMQATRPATRPATHPATLLLSWVALPPPPPPPHTHKHTTTASTRRSPCPHTWAQVRVCRSQTLTFVSLLPVAKAAPPGCALTLSTHDSWPAAGAQQRSAGGLRVSGGRISGGGEAGARGNRRGAANACYAALPTAVSPPAKPPRLPYNPQPQPQPQPQQHPHPPDSASMSSPCSASYRWACRSSQAVMTWRESAGVVQQWRDVMGAAAKVTGSSTDESGCSSGCALIKKDLIGSLQWYPRTTSHRPHLA